MTMRNLRIVSANDLLKGDVIYLAQDGGWTRRLAAAALARTEAEAATLLERAEAQPHRAVGPFLADVALDGAEPRPLHRRELFRARGPSTRPDLGRQAEDQ